MCAIFVGGVDLARRVEASKLGGWCRVRKRGSLGEWLLLFLIRRIHDATDFSYWAHVDMVR